MPTLWYDDYALRCKRMKEKKAKILAKGIKPGSSKFYKLLYRRSF